MRLKHRSAGNVIIIIIFLKINVSPHTHSVDCLSFFSTVWQLIEHDPRLETRWSDLCQDEGLSTLACKSESGPLTDTQSSAVISWVWPFMTFMLFLLLIFFPLLHFLLDWWSPGRCRETIQHQISHLLLRHSWNVSSWPHHCYFTVYILCSITHCNLKA